ncbi:MAG: 3-oxoacyl-[Peptococcaceae bacterium]|nr:3-oxoacyl-[acyl-carrier-protein] reductase [Peptococcaceae bacterium]
MLLENKVAFVTGASRGIGKAIALEMAKSGADVAVCYSSSSDAAEDVCRQIRQLGRKAVPYRCDVSSMEQCSETVKAAVEEFGHLDILVNNAGITRDNLMLMMKEDDFDSVISTNLKGAFNMMKQAGAHFLKRKQGTIINISSVSGMMGNAGQVNYAAAKAGVIGMTKSAAKELAGRGITCNAIAPGFIATDMTDKLSDKQKEAVTDAIPLKRMGQPEDIAHLAVFLASPLANYITGEVIKVDGGIYI